MKFFYLFLYQLILLSASGESIKYLIQVDTYNQEKKIPIFMEIKSSNDIWVYNAQDSFKLLDVKNQNGKIHAQFPVFNSEINFEIGENLDLLLGKYTDRDKEKTVSIFGKRIANFDQRFMEIKNLEKIAPKWEFTFNYGSKKERKGILELNLQLDNKIYGSLLTPSGDYRFLEGGFDGENLMLSTLDGKFAYLIEAQIVADGHLKGFIYNPFSAATPFEAIPNSQYELPDAYDMTQIVSKEGPNKKFTDLNGNAFQLNKPKYQGKVTLIQIGGSWCPNCLDESRLLSEWYQKYSKGGLEIVGLFFEISDKPERSLPKLNKLKNYLNIPYTLLFAGNTQAETVKAALPMMEQLKAYPTLLIYDKNYRLIKVHTGFSGPSTSQYANYKLEMEKLIEELLSK